MKVISHFAMTESILCQDSNPGSTALPPAHKKWSMETFAAFVAVTAIVAQVQSRPMLAQIFYTLALLLLIALLFLHATSPLPLNF
jgi:hypothetical protein